MTRTDTTLMRRALRLAARGRGRTSPNPPVGAVVARGSEVVGEGWHARAGGPHGEIEALRSAGERARGATLYVSLEPCTHQGRTPPCAPAVIEAGISRVVVGTIDPNPAENGAGIEALRSAGIGVEVGVMEIEARRMIEAFACSVASGRPFVTAKAGVTLDGRVAAADGSSRWITGPTARRDAHRLRAACDAVMVGVGTVLRDDPHLTVRLRGFKGTQPLRVVLDSSGRTPPSSAVLDGAAPTLVVVTEKATDDATALLGARGAEVVRVQARDGRVDLAAALGELGRRSILEVLLEGGPTLLGDAVERGLVERYVLYLAPKLLGASGIPVLSGFVIGNVADARELRIHSVRHVGADLRVEAYPRR
jgi:diaminohydroxyphosphoribosylaminopyrimidine deaminase/5-amino-6-(5-phosphoribosylamino)uracil reductase